MQQWINRCWTITKILNLHSHLNEEKALQCFVMGNTGTFSDLETFHRFFPFLQINYMGTARKLT